MLTDTDGNKSLTHTFAIIAFAVVVLKFLASGVSISIASHSFSFGTIDALSIAALLTPTFGAYVARRYPASVSDAGSKPNDGGA
jgi:hypothetical protein